MKKLLLAFIIMMGIGTAASAQTSEALNAKKEAIKKQEAQPSFTTAEPMQTKEEAKPAEPVAADKAAPVKVAEEPKKAAQTPAAPKKKNS